MKEALRAERMDSREVSPFTSIPAAARAAAASSADMLSIPASAIASSDAATPGSLRPSRSFYRRLIQAAGGASASRAVRALANRRHVHCNEFKKNCVLDRILHRVHGHTVHTEMAANCVAWSTERVQNVRRPHSLEVVGNAAYVLNS